jgi:hypothetical protein
MVNIRYRNSKLNAVKPHILMSTALSRNEQADLGDLVTMIKLVTEKILLMPESNLIKKINLFKL